MNGLKTWVISLTRLEVEVLMAESLRPECTICLGQVISGSQEELEQCGHIFHSSCVGILKAAGASKCPVCRWKLTDLNI